VRLNKRTSKSRVNAGERLDSPAEMPNGKPMMELDAGSNVWYQAYVLKESLNEAKVRFPREFAEWAGAGRGHVGGCGRTRAGWWGAARVSHAAACSVLWLRNACSRGVVR
jgi:hypothetical protein